MATFSVAHAKEVAQDRPLLASINIGVGGIAAVATAVNLLLGINWLGLGLPAWASMLIVTGLNIAASFLRK